MTAGPAMVLPLVGRDGITREEANPLEDIRVPAPFGRWGEETLVHPVGYYDGRMAPGGGAMEATACNPDGLWASARHLFDAIQSSEGDAYDEHDELRPKAFRLVLTCVRCGVVRELRGHLDRDDGSVPGDRQVGQLDPTPVQAGPLVAQEIDRRHVWGDDWDVTWTVYSEGRPVGWLSTQRGPRGKRYVAGAFGRRYDGNTQVEKGATAIAVLRKLAKQGAPKPAGAVPALR